MAKVSNPRWLWITSIVVGVVCTAAFGIALLSTGDDESARGAGPGSAVVRTTGRGGVGFGAGLVIGIGAGIAIGLAIARQVQASRDHSSRNKP